MTDIVTVEINCPDEATAAAIAEALVARRLAAAVAIPPPVASLYRRRGELVRTREVPLTLRARTGLFPALAAAARALHPWETPSILARPVTDATDDYRAWLLAETEAPDINA